MIGRFSRTISGNVIISTTQPEKGESMEPGGPIASASEGFEVFHAVDQSSHETLDISPSIAPGAQKQMMGSSSIQILSSSTEDRSTRSPVDPSTSPRSSDFRDEAETSRMTMQPPPTRTDFGVKANEMECHTIEGSEKHRTRLVKGTGHQDSGLIGLPDLIVEEVVMSVSGDQANAGVTAETVIEEWSVDENPSWIRRTSSDPQSTLSFSTESSTPIHGMATRLLSRPNNSRFQSASNSNDLSFEITLAGASQDIEFGPRRWNLFNGEVGMGGGTLKLQQDEDRVKFRHFMLSCIQRFDPSFSLDVVSKRQYSIVNGGMRPNPSRDTENQKFQELTERFLTLEGFMSQRTDSKQSGSSRTDNSDRHFSFDQMLNGEFFQAMEVRQNIRPHDSLDKELKRRQAAGKSKRSVDPCFLRARSVFCFLCMCISFFWGARSLDGWWIMMQSPIEAIRFNLDFLPRAALLNSSVLSPNFRFWDRHCEIMNWVPMVTDASITVNGSEPYHHFTAFEVQSEGSDLAVKTVEYFVGGVWTSKRSSRLTHSVDGSLVFLDDWAAPGIDGKMYTLQPLWSWILVVSIGYLVNGVALLYLLLSSLCFMPFLVQFHTCLRCIFVMHFFLHAVDAVVHLTQSLYKDSFLPIARAVLLAKVARELHSAQTIQLLGTFTSNALIYIAALVIDRSWVHEDPASLTRSWEFTIAFTIIASILISFNIWNRYTRRRLASLKSRFEATGVSCVWMELLSQSNNDARLKNFCEHLSDTFPDSLARSGIRHCFRPVKRAEVDDRDDRTLPLFRRIVRQISAWRRVDGPNDAFPTRSLDQLYQQAAAVQPMFLTHLRLWATQTKAWLPGNLDEQVRSQVITAGSNNEAHERNFVLYAGKSQDHMVSWPRVKSFRSSLEKIATRCEGDTSRCCDIVRGVLLFSTLDGIAEALKVISAAPSVSVKRVKSNMSCEASSNPFRFVKISFCLITEDAVKLGVEGFVCELLLTFKKIWQAKDQREYQEFRKLANGLQILGGSLLFPSSSSHKDQESTSASMKSQEPPTVGCVSHEGVVGLTADVAESQISRFRESACTPAGKEDEEILGDVEEAVRDASPASVWLMANPIEAATAKHEYFFLIVGLFFGTLAVTIVTLQQWNAEDLIGSKFRFTSHLTRGGESPKINSFGVASGGCLIEGDVNITTFDDKQTAYLTFLEGEIEYDAWYWVTSAGQPDSDPIVFSLEVQGVSGRWETVGTSGSKEITQDSYHHELVEYPTPEDRLRLITFPAGTSFTYKANFISSSVLVLGWTLFFCFKIIKKEQHTVRLYFIILVASYGMTIFVGSLAVMQVPQGIWIPQMVVGIMVVLYALLLASVGWGFRYFSELMLVVFTVAFVLYIVMDLLLYGKQISIRMIPLSMYSLFLFGLAIKFLQLYQWRKIKKLMEKDKVLNLGIWDKIIHKEGEVEGLRQVARLLQPYNMPTSKGVLQRGIEFHGSFETEGRLQPLWWRNLSFQVPAGNTSIGVPQTSLSLLLHQAKSLQPFLFEKVRELSLASNGLFPMTGDDGRSQFIPASEVLANPQLLEKVKWPPLKRIDRIRQKLHRCYNSDVSKLCDLCRATIVHRTAADLLACMDWLMNDEDIHVLRTKNSMDPDSDPQHLSAFRQVSVNLMISSEGTKRMGVSMHVAEIQLLLLPFAEIKTLDGHKRYILLRDARGE